MNKRLIAIFAVMAVFVLTLVVGAVVFTVSDVNILLASDDNVSFDKGQLLEISGIKKGQSVFTIDAEKASQNIEKHFPELKVVKVERSFPNKVRIHLDKRVPIFKLQIANSDSFAVLDRELKIIDIVEDDSNVYNQEEVVVILGYSFSGGTAGDFISDTKSEIAGLKSIIGSLEKLQVVNQRIPATFDYFKIISGDVASSNNYIELKTVLGVKIVIRTLVDFNNGKNPIEYQCDILYPYFFNTMSEIEREQPNYLYLGNNGIEVGPTLNFLV